MSLLNADHLIFDVIESLEADIMVDISPMLRPSLPPRSKKPAWNVFHNWKYVDPELSWNSRFT
jgi:hypothetical protein